MDRANPRDTAEAIWRAGVAAVGGYTSVSAALQADSPPRPDRIVAVGKAAAGMATAAREHYGEVACLIVTKYGHYDGEPSGHGVQLIEAGHPVPDANSLAGGAALLAAVAGLGPDSRLLLLVSGGASALVEHLRDGLTLTDLRQENARMLAGGIDIHAINARRKEMSAIKGGGLLAAFPGERVDVLAISDVEGDDIAVIGSGIGARPPGMAADRYFCRIVASNAMARQAAAQHATRRGLTVVADEESLYGDVFALAENLGPRLRAMDRGVAIFGGEPTVVLPANPGEGGRNQALALALAREIAGVEKLCVLAAGTDGSDGPTQAAGGFADGSTWGEGASEALGRANSGSFLGSRGCRFAPGPTGTNVMDLLVAVRG